MIASVLRSGGAEYVYPIRYGFFDLLRFLVPGLRAGPIRRVLRELRDVRDDHPSGEADLAVLAHSFGTYIVAHVLRDNPDIKVARLLLCGSIVARDFRWDQIKGQLHERVLNDCGTLDILPVLAQSVTWGFGASGTFGFGSARVRDRFHRVGHSAFFSRAFAEQFWRPFVLRGEVVPSQWDERRPPSPWWQSLLAILPLRWIGVALLMLGAAMLAERQLDRPASMQFVGVVRDAQGFVSGATVVAISYPESQSTASNGEFVLDLPETKVGARIVLRVVKEGYRPYTAPYAVRRGGEAVVITLERLP